MKPSTRRVLLTLRAAGQRGACTAELCIPAVGGARFGARLLELRKFGCVIDGRRECAGSHRYWLRQEPPGLLPSPTPSTPAPTPVVEGDGGQLALIPDGQEVVPRHGLEALTTDRRAA